MILLISGVDLRIQAIQEHSSAIRLTTLAQITPFQNNHPTHGQHLENKSHKQRSFLSQAEISLHQGKCYVMVT